MEAAKHPIYTMHCDQDRFLSMDQMNPTRTHQKINRVCSYQSKGGVGKTTLSVVLSLGLQLPLRDLDPQRSATKWLARREVPHPLAGPGSERWVADCPPGISGDHIGALASSDLVVIPVRAAFTDLEALPDTVKFVQAHCRGTIGFLLSDIDGRTHDEQMLRRKLHSFGHPVLGMFSHRAAYGRAGMVGGLPGDFDQVAREEMDKLVAAVEALA